MLAFDAHLSRFLRILIKNMKIKESLKSFQNISLKVGISLHLADQMKVKVNFKVLETDVCDKQAINKNLIS